jgi:peptidoglycan L-alanyl-D-glutamate endopeptidase CwlK
MADLKNLTPELKTKLAMFQRACVAQKMTTLKGNDILITQGFRSSAEQNKLYAIGRTVKGAGVSATLPMGRTVTNARGGKSMHNLGEIGVKCGLIWGGNWTIAKEGIVDRPHFQLK